MLAAYCPCTCQQEAAGGLTVHPQSVLNTLMIVRFMDHPVSPGFPNAALPAISKSCNGPEMQAINGDCLAALLLEVCKHVCMYVLCMAADHWFQE